MLMIKEANVAYSFRDSKVRLCYWLDSDGESHGGFHNGGSMFKIGIQGGVWLIIMILW